MTTDLDLWQPHHEQVLRDDAGPAWLGERRRDAMAAFLKRGYPTTRDEAWRYTDVRPLARTAWTPAPDHDDATLARARAVLERHPKPEAATCEIVILNGRQSPALSRSPGDCELQVGRTADASEDLLDLVPVAEHPFAALNGAMFPEAVVLDIPADRVIDAPIHVVHVSIGGSEARVAHPRLLVRAGARSRVALLFTWIGDTDAAFLSNGVGEIRLDEGARIDVVDVQRQPDTAHHIWNLGVHVAGGASFSTCCLQLGAHVSRNDVHVHLDAEDAACRLDGVAFLGGHQHMDVQTRVEHTQPHGDSHQLWKTVLHDHARTAFAGTVHVHPGAQKTDATQANHNLLLSPNAISDSVPMLEIYADDVKCAHGATVGQLDPDALFYLRARGIGVEDATNMLVRAFADEVPGRIEHDILAAHAHDALAVHLEER